MATKILPFNHEMWALIFQTTGGFGRMEIAPFQSVSERLSTLLPLPNVKTIPDPSCDTITILVIAAMTFS